jgi:hypothetical protein
MNADMKRTRLVGSCRGVKALADPAFTSGSGNAPEYSVNFAFEKGDQPVAEIHVRAAVRADLPQLTEIYNHYGAPG